MDETLPQEEALERLYGQYQQLVSASGVLESYPRLPLPDDLRYVGSKQCASCHEYAYSRWETKAHADAFATLVEVGSDRDPECVICHVVGMDRAQWLYQRGADAGIEGRRLRELPRAPAPNMSGRGGKPPRPNPK